MAKLMKIKRISIFLILFLLIFPILLSRITIINNSLRENKNSFPTLSSNGVELEWERSWGGNGQDLAYDIEIDSSNNIYVAGNTNLTTLGASALLLKYTSSGNLEWSRTWHETGFVVCYGIALDSFNNIYLACLTHVPPFIYFHIVLLKYTSAGVLDWYREMEVGTMCIPSGIAIDSSNNIYISGWSDSGGVDTLLIKCDNSGFPIWNRTWDDGGTETAVDIVLDSSNNIYLSVAAGMPGTPNMGLIKYNSSGDLQWGDIRTVPGWDMFKGVSLDSSEDIYLAGSTQVTGNSQMCYVKYDSSGQYQGNATWGGLGVDAAWELDIDSSDNIYLCGTSDVEVPLAHYHVGKATLVNYNSSGYQWDHVRDEPQREGLFAVELDSTEENIYLAGMRENIGSNDTLLIKYKLNGDGTNGDGKKDIPSYNVFLILIFISFTLAYFIKKIHKEKK
jgi:hypothetical protein